MSTGIELKNKGICGVGNLAGFNITKGCAPLLKDIVEIHVTDADFEFDDTRDYDAEYLRELQVAGKLNILKRIDLFESQSSENQYATSSKGYESVAIEGIYKWRATFNHDVWFNKQMGALEGEYHKRVVFVDSRGSHFKTEGTSENKSRGFLVAHITRGMQTFLNGTNKQAQYLDMQFAYKDEFDERPVIFDGSLLDLDVKQLEPIVQAKVSFKAVPSASDTSVVLNVVYDRGNKGFVNGLTTSGDFKVLINGVEEAADTAVQGAEDYTITTTALSANDVIEVSINGVKEVIDDAVYVSNTAKIQAV